MSRDENSKIVARIKCCEYKKDINLLKRVIEAFPRQLHALSLIRNSSKRNFGYEGRNFKKL